MPSLLIGWATILFAGVDAYPFEYQHNYYLYHNLHQQIEWISWDVNVNLGLDKIGNNNNLQALSVLYIAPPESGKPLCQRMLADSIYKHQYLRVL